MAASALVLLAIGVFSAKHFMKGGWPLKHADPILVVAAAVLFLIAYAFKAWGWQRLFKEDVRPRPARSPSRAARHASAASRCPAGSTTRFASPACAASRARRRVSARSGSA